MKSPTTGSTRLSPGTVRGVEAGLARQADRVPQVGPFVVLVGRDARGFARAVVRLLLVQVHRPDVVVERDDARRASVLGARNEK